MIALVRYLHAALLHALVARLKYNQSCVPGQILLIQAVERSGRPWPGAALSGLNQRYCPGEHDWFYTSWTVITRSTGSLARENNGIAQTRVTLFYTINRFGPSAERAFQCLSVCLFVCKFVMSLWDHNKGRCVKFWSFAKQLGLIAWLCESMSRRNPSSRSASSPIAEEKTFHLFSSCCMLGKGLSRFSRHLKHIPLAKDLHQVLKPKTVGTWGATDIATHRIKHHLIRHLLPLKILNEWRRLSMRIVQC